MFKTMKIVNTLTRLSKSIHINDYTVRDLNAITEFYENHGDYIIIRS